MRPAIGFELYTTSEPKDIITHVHVTNNSTFFCEVYTNFNMQVYDTPIQDSPRYAGKEPWYVLPGQTTKGGFLIYFLLLASSVIKKIKWT